MAQQWSSVGEQVSTPTLDPPTPRTPENMYRMKRVRKPELWDFIRLVRKDEFAGVSKDDLINENAKGAHCLKCGKDIPYYKGKTNYVRMHMEARHPSHVSMARQSPSQIASSSFPSDVEVTTHPMHETSQPITSATGECLYDPESDSTIPRTPENMFRMKRTRKPELWDFIRLVRKDEYAHLSQENLSSDHAVCAHCLKCGLNITFRKGKTTSVKKHMELRHPGHLSAARPSLRLTNNLPAIPSRQRQALNTAASPAPSEAMSEPESDPRIPRTPENMFMMKGVHKPNCGTLSVWFVKMDALMFPKTTSSPTTPSALIA